MTAIHVGIPTDGYLRLHQIIGTMAARQPSKGSDATSMREKRRSSSISLPPLIPVSRSTWWRGVKSGRYPAPVRIGPHMTAWRAEDIRRLIYELGVA